MSNWFDSHVVVIGVGNVNTDAIKDAIKEKIEEDK